MVTGRVGKAGAARVSVRMEVESGETAASLVRGGEVFLGLRKEVVLTIRGGGANVPCPFGRASHSVRGCYACGDRGHVQRFCPNSGARALGKDIVGRCWGCGGVGHQVLDCPVRSLPVIGPSGPLPAGTAGIGGVKRTGGPLAGAPAGRGGPLRGARVLGFMGASRAPVGGAPLGTR